MTTRAAIPAEAPPSGEPDRRASSRGPVRERAAAADPYNEAFARDGSPRPHYARLLDALAGTDLVALAETVRGDLAARGVTLAADPLPRVLTAAEWAPVAAGLEQRARAFAAFAADAHGPRHAVSAGVVPADLIDSCRYFEPDLAGTPGAPAALGMAGPDLVRLPSGELVVLEDNVRTPSLKAFAALAAQAVDRHVPAPAPHHDFAAALAGALREVTAAADAIVLSEGGSWAEGEWLARALGLPLAGPRDLGHAGDRLVLRHGRRPVDLVLRHTPEERLRTDAGGATWLADALLRPLRAGTLTVVNPFGAGVADDKRTYAYADAIVRHFTGEAPRLRSVPTLDLARPAALAEALDRLDELVFKPRSGSGGRGIVVGPHARAADLDALRDRLAAEPAAWIAQETLATSTHPVVTPDGQLEPRHVDLRAFVIGGRALPGGLTRYAPAPGDLVVNGSQGGGGKATRVLRPSGPDLVFLAWRETPAMLARHHAAVAAALPEGWRGDVVAVENGAPPPTATASRALIARHYTAAARRTVLRSERNLGFARAINLALAECRAPVALLVNSDGRPAPQMLARLTAALAEWPDAVWAAPAVHGPGEEGGEPGPPRPVDELAGTALAIRRAPFLALGGFDPMLFFYNEDADASRRIRAAGGGLLHVPAARFDHGKDGRSPSGRLRREGLYAFTHQIVAVRHARAPARAVRALLRSRRSALADHARAGRGAELAGIAAAAALLPVSTTLALHRRRHPWDGTRRARTRVERIAL